MLPKEHSMKRGKPIGAGGQRGEWVKGRGRGGRKSRVEIGRQWGKENCSRSRRMAAWEWGRGQRRGGGRKSEVEVGRQRGKAERG
jgi:hypothetical protein